jgi:hypothetical protein
LALNAYWTDVGGSTFLPGTDRPADRFVRASNVVSHNTQLSTGVVLGGPKIDEAYRFRNGAQGRNRSACG